MQIKDKEFEECQETINRLLCRRRKKVEIIDRSIIDDEFGDTVGKKHWNTFRPFEKDNPIYSKLFCFHPQ